MNLIQEILFVRHWEADKGTYFRNKLIWQNQQLHLSPAADIDSSDCLCFFFLVVGADFLLPFLPWLFFLLNTIFNWYSMAQLWNCLFTFQIRDSYDNNVIGQF